MINKLTTVARNIVLTFDDDLSNQFIKLNERIHRAVPSKIVLNMENMIPHLTIYGTKYPAKNVGVLEARLSSLVKRLRPFTLRLNSKSIVAGTIFLDAELSKKLYTLHVKLTDGMNPFREGLYDEKELELPGLTQGMKDSLVNYGMLLSKEEYVPHVTVARPFDSQRCEEALSVLPEKIDFETKITSISLVETGPNGTCKRIIQSFPFRTENHHVS